MKNPFRKKEPTPREAFLRTYLDCIAPGVVKFEVDHYIFGSTYRCVWALREYPASTEAQAILRHLGEKSGVTLRIYCRQVSPGEEDRIIDNANKKNKLDGSDPNKLRQTVEAESNLRDVAELVHKMHREHEPLLHCAVYLEMTADSMEGLKRLQTDVLTELVRCKLNVDKLLLRQKQGFCCVSPVGHNALGREFERVLPAGSVANFYPFNYSGKTDPKGIYIGKDKYGTANPVPFRVVDRNVGLDMDIGIRCFGEYSYRMSDPMLFYKNVCGNIASEYTRDRIDSQLKTELLTALQPAFAKISEMGIRYSALPGHTTELASVLNDVLSEQWKKLRGVEVVSVGVSSITANEEDEKMIKELQRNAAFRDPKMAGAHLVGAQAAAMQAAAANENAGAFMGFAGMNMAQNAAGNVQGLFQMGQQQQAAPVPTAPAAPVPTAPAAPAAGAWTCACGAVNTGKFCSECGAKKPSDEWTCACGAVNKGKFCSECGAKRPE